jgi:hypothetical protein
MDYRYLGSIFRGPPHWGDDRISPYAQAGQQLRGPAGGGARAITPAVVPRAPLSRMARRHARHVWLFTAFFRCALTLVPVPGRAGLQDVSTQGPGSGAEPGVLLPSPRGRGAAAVASPMREPLLSAAPAS